METLGFIDRIEEGKVVIIVEKENKEFVIDKKDINKNLREGDWLRIELRYGDIDWFEKDNKLTEEKKNIIKQKANKVRSKSKESKFKKRGD